jgi:hypothetical protein
MEENMLWCLPCSDRKLVFAQLCDGGPPSGSCFNSSCDEDINTLATLIPSVEILGPIT